jgi:hypothetical protein
MDRGSNVLAGTKPGEVRGMKKFAVSYTTNELYTVDIEAETEEEAIQKVNDGDFEESTASHDGTEFLGTTEAEEISE